MAMLFRRRTSGDEFPRGKMPWVDGANHHDRDFGLDVGKGAVSQSPDDMFSAVVTDSTLVRLTIAVVLLPDVPAASFPSLSDGITDERKSNVSLSGVGCQLSISRLPARLVATHFRNHSRMDMIELLQIDVPFLQPFQDGRVFRIVVDTRWLVITLLSPKRNMIRSDASYHLSRRGQTVYSGTSTAQAGLFPEQRLPRTSVEG